MTKYRFKTEAEFIKEFGDGWNLKIKRAWNKSGKMDHLFGTLFEVGEPVIKSIFVGCSEKVNGFWISEDMITPIDITTVSVCDQDNVVLSESLFCDSIF